jgi:mono/diheme cytochrome c family protein
VSTAVACVLCAGLLGGCSTNLGGPQGWSEDARNAWYNTDQGSRLMPLKWFEALERPDGATPGKLSDADYLATFRILPPRPGGTLPIGFAVDRIADDSGFPHTGLHWTGRPAKDDPVDWVGLNCAACHTARMTYGGQDLTVDGAPSLFDYQSFIEAVDKSLVETRESGEPGGDGRRWDRFARSVLGAGDDNPANRARLLIALGSLNDWEARTEALNHTDLRYGYGRVDAVGHIYNRILLFGGAPQPAPNPSDAPVSYPHLWNIYKQTHLQWDGIASTSKINIGATPTDFGALGRNTGEVLGVFGEVAIRPPAHPGDLTGFRSTAHVETLNQIEVLLTNLQPPEWPEKTFGVRGAIDVTDATGRKLSPTEVIGAGQQLFQAHCAGCHTPHANYETMVTFAELGKKNVTDEWMACNTWAYTGQSGALTGVPANYVNGDPLAANAPVRALLTTAVKGALINQKQDLVVAVADNIFGVTPLPHVVTPQGAEIRPPSAKDLRLAYCLQNANDPLMAYKARPLEGIWATAPYLHNGSVPTLYALLEAPADRPRTFNVGTRVYDPQKVGYDTRPGANGNSFVFDTSLPGNSNKGHDYGVGSLTETERLELLEYLKGARSDGT